MAQWIEHVNIEHLILLKLSALIVRTPSFNTSLTESFFFITFFVVVIFSNFVCNIFSLFYVFYIVAIHSFYKEKCTLQIHREI